VNPFSLTKDELRDEVDRLRERITHLEERREHILYEMLEWRGIEPGMQCSSCGGSGRRTYSSTATWRGGIGGQACTDDVCDGCWGSGTTVRKGINLRAILSLSSYVSACETVDASGDWKLTGDELRTLRRLLNAQER